MVCITISCHRSPQADGRAQDSLPSSPHTKQQGMKTAPDVLNRALPSKAGQASENTAANDDAILLKKRTEAIFIAKGAGGTFSEAAIMELRAMVPSLQSAGIFWDIMGGISDSQISRFKDSILPALRALEMPKSGNEVNREFAEAYSAASALNDPAVAGIALETLSKAPPYVFPNTAPPPPWSETNTPGSLERLMHGAQGILASTIVKLGDEDTLGKFREQLKTIPAESQRVCIWALGRSPKLEDFELLISLREKITDPGSTDTLMRALNRIPQNMKNLADSPESFPAYRRPKDPKALLETAERCKTRLNDLKLVVPLTIYD